MTPPLPDASRVAQLQRIYPDGGDNFAVLKSGTDRLGGDVDLDAVKKYFASQAAPFAPPALGRITLLP